MGREKTGIFFFAGGGGGTVLVISSNQQYGISAISVPLVWDIFGHGRNVGIFLGVQVLMLGFFEV